MAILNRFRFRIDFFDMLLLPGCCYQTAAMMRQHTCRVCIFFFLFLTIDACIHMRSGLYCVQRNQRRVQ